MSSLQRSSSPHKYRLFSCSWRDALVIFSVTSVLAAVTHLWLAERLAVLRAVFPVQAQLVVWSGTCSSSAPEWMAQLLGKTTHRLISPANQLVYIDRDGEIHHCENGWHSTMWRSPRVDVSSRYRYASVSKLFTADAVLGLVADGQLDLHTPLTDLFPELPPPLDPGVSQITIDQLLRHRAGFDRLRSEDPVTKHHHRSWCPYDMSELSRLRLDFEPGTRYAYSNLGYCLLGQVVERVVGQDFRTYLNSEYRLGERGVHFIDGPYEADEVSYDFRTSEFYGPDYSNFFDFQAFSAVAGLSGSAIALVESTAEMLQRQDSNLLSASIDEDCDLKQLQSCYGYSFYKYMPGDELTLYINEGFFPGTLPLLIVDSEGGILALLPSGAPMPGSDNKKMLIDELYSALVNHYRG